MNFLRKLGLGAAIICGLVEGSNTAAFAAIDPRGCANLAAQYPGVPSLINSYAATYNVGDKITFSFDPLTANSFGVGLGAPTKDLRVIINNKSVTSYTYEVKLAGTYTLLANGSVLDGDTTVAVPVKLTASCTSASTGTNVQAMGAQLQGQNAQSNINDILDGAISASASSSFQAFSASVNSVAMMVAPGQEVRVTAVADSPGVLASDSPWRLWMAGRYTHASGTETGDQFNGLFGTSYRLGGNKALGIFGGYESFNYTDATPSQLSGNGLTFGGFVAGSFKERLKLDARAYTSFMNYNIVTGATSGAFGAQRVGASLTASYEFGSGANSITPSLRGSSLFEWQNAYTDSAAVAHAAQSLAQGAIAPGIRLAHTAALSNGWHITPYIGGEVDFVLGNTNLAGFAGTQGISVKVLAGSKWALPHGVSLGLDASYGGIGSSINSQSIQATLNLPL